MIYRRIIAALCCTALLCGCGGSNPSSSEQVTAAVTDAETTAGTEPETVPDTEAHTEAPESFGELKYPETMTEKERANTAYRRFSLLDPELASNYGSYQGKWTFSNSYMRYIYSSVRELKIYDEQLDTDFLVHITLPPDYDESREYPVFFVSDAIWWFGEVPYMWKTVEDGEAEPVIFVTLGYEYSIDGTSDDTRFEKFVVYQDKTLDFITNDLMQLVSLNYKTDSSRSVFFGHSGGGLFSHYALCNSDKYEYQPFHDYIIGSPAFWGYYLINDFDASAYPEPDRYQSDFGYFDRHETMDKRVFICAGSQEDADYAEAFNGHQSTTEGAHALYERLKSHGTDVSEKLYESHHYQYLPDMFIEYLKMTFPPEK